MNEYYQLLYGTGTYIYIVPVRILSSQSKERFGCPN
jgi:hypothetical protein